MAVIVEVGVTVGAVVEVGVGAVVLVVWRGGEGEAILKFILSIVILLLIKSDFIILT